ncbi:MAG TPA: acyltransferase domain-containing protein, partial [Jatrophihabitans sp.]|nr:acyltransferase domain-containing protein [Jatrophihabitans sp.]
TWQSWGITPDAVLGLSIGEMAAGLLADVFTLDEVVPAIAIRAQALEDSPPGGMIAVSASRDEVAPLLPADVWIAVHSGPRQLVVSGAGGPLAEATRILEGAGLSCYPVPTTHAAHCPLLAPAVPVFDRAIRELRLTPPTIDFYSAGTGRLVSADEAVDPGFWSGQLARPVLFADAVDALTDTADRLLLVEVGPGQTLSKLLRRHPAVVAGRHRAVPTLAHRPVEPLAQVRSALAAVAQLLAEGVAVDPAELGGLDDIGPAAQPAHPDRQHAGSPVLATAATAEAQSPEPPAAADDPIAEPDGASATVTDRLRRLWTEVLAEDDIAEDADFFDLGGNSLTAMDLMAKVRAEFDVDLGVVILFDHSTLDALAGQIERRVG